MQYNNLQIAAIIRLGRKRHTLKAESDEAGPNLSDDDMDYSGRPWRRRCCLKDHGVKGDEVSMIDLSKVEL